MARKKSGEHMLTDPIATAHTAGWRIPGEKRWYFYDLGAPEDYSGPVPAGFALLDVLGGYDQVAAVHPSTMHKISQKRCAVWRI